MKSALLYLSENPYVLAQAQRYAAGADGAARAKDIVPQETVRKASAVLDKGQIFTATTTYQIGQDGKPRVLGVTVATPNDTDSSPYQNAYRRPVTGNTGDILPPQVRLQPADQLALFGTDGESADIASTNPIFVTDADGRYIAIGNDAKAAGDALAARRAGDAAAAAKRSETPESYAQANSLVASAYNQQLQQSIFRQSNVLALIA